jgi:hypothetical protein
VGNSRRSLGKVAPNTIHHIITLFNYTVASSLFLPPFSRTSRCCGKPFLSTTISRDTRFHLRGNQQQQVHAPVALSLCLTFVEPFPEPSISLSPLRGVYLLLPLYHLPVFTAPTPSHRSLNRPWYPPSIARHTSESCIRPTSKALWFLYQAGHSSLIPVSLFPICFCVYLDSNNTILPRFHTHTHTYTPFTRLTQRIHSTSWIRGN